MRANRCLLLALFLPLILFSQASTRAEQIEQERLKKQAELKPDQNTGIENRLIWLKDSRLLERVSQGAAGLSLRLGGLATFSGFAAGPEYARQDLLGGNLNFRTSARFSTKAYELYDLQLTAPHLLGGRAIADVYIRHRNYPRVDYYGPGPDSEKSGRTAFRLEDTRFEGMAGINVLPQLRVGGTMAYLMVNTGPRTDDDIASTERVFSPLQTPGVRDQTNFLVPGAFVHLDYRDNPLAPRAGGSYLVGWNRYQDQELGRHTFNYLDLNFQQYIPFFNQRRVIALRSRNVFTFRDRGQRVPFYLQPTLGGSDDLRGFRPFRFYGDNMMVLNAEYRYEVFSGLDMAIFADAGKVFNRRNDWNLDDLESSVGFGFRFNIRNQVFMRLDTGFSHEGFQFWMKFGNVFLEPYLER